MPYLPADQFSVVRERDLAPGLIVKEVGGAHGLVARILVHEDDLNVFVPLEGDDFGQMRICDRHDLRFVVIAGARLEVDTDSICESLGEDGPGWMRLLGGRAVITARAAGGLLGRTTAHFTVSGGDERDAQDVYGNGITVTRWRLVIPARADFSQVVLVSHGAQPAL